MSKLFFFFFYLIKNNINIGNYKNLKKKDDIHEKLFKKKKSKSEIGNENGINNSNIGFVNNGSKNKLSFKMYVEDESDNNDFEDISWTERKFYKKINYDFFI